MTHIFPRKKEEPAFGKFPVLNDSAGASHSRAWCQQHALWENSLVCIYPAILDSSKNDKSELFTTCKVVLRSGLSQVWTHCHLSKLFKILELVSSGKINTWRNGFISSLSKCPCGSMCVKEVTIWVGRLQTHLAYVWFIYREKHSITFGSIAKEPYLRTKDSLLLWVFCKSWYELKRWFGNHCWGNPAKGTPPQWKKWCLKAISSFLILPQHFGNSSYCLPILFLSFSLIIIIFPIFSWIHDHSE